MLFFKVGNVLVQESTLSSMEQRTGSSPDSAGYLVKSRARFAIATGSLGLTVENRIHPFRDEAALKILRCVVSGLRKQGYVLSEPRHGMACDAISRCKFGTFWITIMLILESGDTASSLCGLHTWPRPPGFSLFRRRLSTTDEIAGEWTKLCMAIDGQLKQQPDINSLTWFTQGESKSLNEQVHKGAS